MDLKKLKNINKKKVIIFGTIMAGVIATSIAVPIVIVNKNKKKQNRDDVHFVYDILAAKSNKERVIVLPSSSSGKIIADNKEKIIEKIKGLIGKTKLKGVCIDISMKKDSDISANEQSIIVTIKKIDHTLIIKDDSSKVIKVKKS